MDTIDVTITLGGTYTVDELFPDGAPVPLTSETAQRHLFGTEFAEVPTRDVGRIIEELSLLEHAAVKVTVLRSRAAGVRDV